MPAAGQAYVPGSDVARQDAASARNATAAELLRAALDSDSDDPAADNTTNPAAPTTTVPGPSRAADGVVMCLAGEPAVEAVPECFRDMKLADVKITILGTGSAEPSKVRISRMRCP